MLSLESGPLVETPLSLPTALSATPVSTSTASTPADPSTAMPDAVPAITERHRNDWAPLLAALVIAVAGGVMLFLQRRRDTR
jgi:hypothetical protein